MTYGPSQVDALRAEVQRLSDTVARVEKVAEMWENQRARDVRIAGMALRAALTDTKDAQP